TELSTIPQYFQVLETIATSGQPAEEQFKLIAEQGYSSVINLALSDSDKAIAGEGGIVAGLGMNYVHLPVPFDNPTVRHLRNFIGIVKVLENQKVWVHCVVNARVSAFMYHYLILEKGYPEDAAKTPLLKTWSSRKMDEVWRKFLALSLQDINS
ncbi:MAG: protein tyrosine phosphatase family protein, partial [Methylococcaceae bacterium]|nr:protein tyrosine phosphatase family protein [Methylococcaceae bacterium]